MAFQPRRHDSSSWERYRGRVSARQWAILLTCTLLVASCTSDKQGEGGASRPTQHWKQRPKGHHPHSGDKAKEHDTKRHASPPASPTTSTTPAMERELDGGRTRDGGPSAEASKADGGVEVFEP